MIDGYHPRKPTAVIIERHYCTHVLPMIKMIIVTNQYIYTHTLINVPVHSTYIIPTTTVLTHVSIIDTVDSFSFDDH